MHTIRRHGNELGITPVAFAAHQAHWVRIGSCRIVYRRVDNDSQAEEVLVYGGTNGHDAAGDIGSLDAREVERSTPTRQRRRVSRSAIRALPCP